MLVGSCTIVRVITVSLWTGVYYCYEEEKKREVNKRVRRGRLVGTRMVNAEA